MSKLRNFLSQITVSKKEKKSFEENELTNMGAGEADERK